MAKRRTKGKALTTIEFRQLGGLGGISEAYRRPLVHTAPTVEVRYNRFQVIMIHARLDAGMLSARRRSARADEVVEFICDLMVLASQGEEDRFKDKLRKMLKRTVTDEALIQSLMFTMEPRLEPRETPKAEPSPESDPEPTPEPVEVEEEADPWEGHKPEKF